MNINDYTLSELKEVLALVGRLKKENQELKNRLNIEPYVIINKTSNNNDWDTPVIQHFKDESGYDTSYDSPPIGGFSDD